MTSGNNGKNVKGSATNLMQLLEVQPSHHVVTRQDLMRDYNSKTSVKSLNSDDNDDDDEDDDEDNKISINNYYTWNSPRTNASIHKERKAIISTLHSAESVPNSSSPPLYMPLRPRSASLSSSCSWPLASKSFIRSHRVEDIVAMCLDERNAFSTDEYRNNETARHTDDRPPVWETSSRPGHSGWRSAARRNSSAASPGISSRNVSSSNISSSSSSSSSDSNDKPAGGRIGRTTAGPTSHHQTHGPAPPSTPQPLSILEWAFGLFRKK